MTVGLSWMIFGVGTMQPASAAESWETHKDAGLAALKQSNYAVAQTELTRALAEAEKFGQNDKRVSACLDGLMRLYGERSKFDDAVAACQRSLLIKEAATPTNEAEIAFDLNYLGLLYFNQSKYDLAARTSLKALAINEKVFGKDSVKVAETLDNLAIVEDTQGKLSVAEDYYTRALAIFEKTPDQNVAELARCLDNFAGLHVTQGKVTLAEEKYQRALALNEKCGPKNPAVAISLNHLANVYMRERKYDQAESLYKRALALNTEIFGANHNHTAASLNNLAGVYKAQGKYPEAEKLFQQSIDVYEKSLSGNNTELATALSAFAQFYIDQGKTTEGEAMYKRALEINRNAFGPDHQNVASCLNGLGDSNLRAGKYSSAASYYRQAIDVEKKSCAGGTSPNLFTYNLGLGTAYLGDKQYAEAEKVIKEQLDQAEKSGNVADPRIAICANNLAVACLKQGKFSEGEPYSKMAVEVTEKIAGAKHINVGRVLITLGRIYTGEKEYPQAEETLKKATSVIDGSSNKMPLDEAKVSLYTAELYAAMGRASDAEPLYKKSIALYQKALPATHPDVIAANECYARFQGKK